MSLSFICKHCGEYYLNEALVKEHEAICDHNVANKTCLTCSKWYWELSPTPISHGLEEGKARCCAGLIPYQRDCNEYSVEEVAS